MSHIERMRILIIAGPDGAGKTTFAEEFCLMRLTPNFCQRGPGCLGPRPPYPGMDHYQGLHDYRRMAG